MIDSLLILVDRMSSRVFIRRLGMSGPSRARDLSHDERGTNRVKRGIVDARSDSGTGGQMNDHDGLHLAHQTRDSLTVADVLLDQASARNPQG